MTAANEPRPAFPSEAWQRLEPLLRRFEAAWVRGQRPPLDDYLPDDPGERRAALVELAHADLEWRLKAHRGSEDDPGWTVRHAR